MSVTNMEGGYNNEKNTLPGKGSMKFPWSDIFHVQVVLPVKFQEVAEEGPSR